MIFIVLEGKYEIVSKGAPVTQSSSNDKILFGSII